MNPFVTPQRIYVCTRPQDMRAGIDRLALAVAAEMGGDPSDGSLFVFVGRDRRRLKMLRYEGGTWCMWYVRLSSGRLDWEFGDAPAASRELGRSQLLWLLEGLDPGAPTVAKRVI